VAEMKTKTKGQRAKGERQGREERKLNGNSASIVSEAIPLSTSTHFYQHDCNVLNIFIHFSI